MNAEHTQVANSHEDNTSLLPIVGHEVFSHLPRFNCHPDNQRIIPFAPRDYIGYLLKNVMTQKHVKNQLRNSLIKVQQDLLLQVKGDAKLR
jgi:hypothetical protein